MPAESSVTQTERQVAHDQGASESISISEWSMSTFIATASFLYLVQFVRYVGAGNADEGIVLQGAVRVLEGQLPYRDFFTFLAPGSYLWTALQFKLFGCSFVEARYWIAAYGTVLTAGTYLLARQIFGRVPSAMAAFVMLTCVPMRFLVLHNWDSSATAFLAIALAVVWLKHERTTYIAAAGLFTGLTILCEQSKGAGLALGLMIGLGLVLRSRGRRWRIPIFAFAVGAIAPLLVTIGYFGHHHALQQMAQDLAWPFQHYSGANHVPYGFVAGDASALPDQHHDSGIVSLIVGLALSTRFILGVIPPLVLLCGILWLSHSPAEEFPKQVVRLSLPTVAVSLAVLFVSHRPDVNHLIYLAPLYLFLSPLILERSISPALSRLRPLFGISVFAAFTFVNLGLLSNVHADTVAVATQRGRVIVQKPNNSLEYLSTHLPPDTPVPVHPYHPLQAFLVGAKPIGRYDYLQVGMHTRAQFEEQARFLDQERPPLILLGMSFLDEVPRTWPNTPIREMGFDPVADFVVRQYHPCKVLTSNIWRFVLFARTQMECPGN